MKIEFDIPEFEKELSVSIVIKKDGEVVYQEKATPSPEDNPMPEVKKPVKASTSKPVKKNTGNFMDSTLFDD